MLLAAFFVESQSPARAVMIVIVDLEFQYRAGLAFFHHILWPANGMRWIRWRNLPNDQKIVQHPHRSELLLNGRFGPWKVLDPGSHMERSHGREFKAVSSAPIKK